MDMPNRKRSRHSALRRNAEGLSLIELMIAMLLGLVVVAAAGGVFLANKRVYASTETVNRIQENTRVSFEIMSRDMREAGGNPCGRDSSLVNQLTSKDSDWWKKFTEGLTGYESADPGTALGNWVAGTDAVDLHLSNDGDYAVTKHDSPSSDLSLNTNSGIDVDDIVMVCNNQYSLIFQVTGLNSDGTVHQGGAGTPGNCGQEFQHEWDATSKCSGASNKNGYCLMVADKNNINPNCSKHSQDPAQLVKIYTARWYIGHNGRGGRSLYRARVVDKGAPTVVETVEVAEGVSDLQLKYRNVGSNAWHDATAVTDWKQVNAVRIELEAEGVEGALGGSYIEGTDGEALSRELGHTVAIRNREGVL